MAEKCKCPTCPVPEYMATYGDMITLVLTFFVLLYAQSMPKAPINEMSLILAAFQGLGNFNGGNTLSEGKLAEMGSTVSNLPSKDRGSDLATAKRMAVSLFSTESKNMDISISSNERGLIISLAGDTFFEPASDKIKIENNRETLQKIANLLMSPSFSDRYFRVEGHTDNVPTDPNGKWRTNWELASARALNIMYYLTYFGVNESKFQTVSFGDTKPIATNKTPEGRAQNRRVEIVVTTTGVI